MIRAPKPSARIQRVLSELAEIQDAGDREIYDLAAAKRVIAELEQQNAKRQSDSSAIRVAVERACADLQRVHQRERADLERRLAQAEGVLQQVEAAIARSRRGIGQGDPDEHASKGEPAVPVEPSSPARKTSKRSTSARTTRVNGGDAVHRGQRRILVALAQHRGGCDRTQLGLFAGLSPKSGTFGTYLSKLRAQGLLESRDHRFFATDAGLQTLGKYEPLPVGVELVRYWLDWLGSGGSRRMLEALVAAGSHGLSRDDLAAAASLSSNSGTFGTYLSRLRSLQLAHGRDVIRVADALLEEPSHAPNSRTSR